MRARSLDRWLLLATILAGACAASGPRPEPVDTPAPAPPGPTELVGSCPEADPDELPLSVADALRLPVDRYVRVVAYLIEHARRCPPCPPRAQCEACLPPYELYCDLPPGVGGEGASFWVAAGFDAPDEAELAEIRPGWQVLLCGTLEPVNEPGTDRVFRLTGLQVLPARAPRF